ncbi:regulatory protein RecX [Sporomusa aerivorans]|uniref:regulatory protein RecX n=1 Tax=Sporomusa aerivorans TaxID=204936 RepID=UPI00352A4F06
MSKDVSAVAVKLLSIRAYSQHELQQKLLQQGYDASAIQHAIEYVTERGYLNDAALCDMLLCNYAETKKYSLRETYIRLRRKGLSAALVADKLAGYDGTHEYQAAIKLAKKYWNSEESQILPKIARRLAAKGFKASTVNKVLEQLRDMLP